MLVLAAQLAVVPLYASQAESGTQRCHVGAVEGSRSGDFGWSWSPPGTRCWLLLPDGLRLDEVVPPWRGSADWTQDASGIP